MGLQIQIKYNGIDKIKMGYRDGIQIKYTWDRDRIQIKYRWDRDGIQIEMECRSSTERIDTAQMGNRQSTWVIWTVQYKNNYTSVARFLLWFVRSMHTGVNCLYIPSALYSEALMA